MPQLCNIRHMNTLPTGLCSVQDSEAKRQRPENRPTAEGAIPEPGAEETAGAGDAKAAPAFSSAGAQDVNTFNETGDSMSAVPETVATEVRAPLPDLEFAWSSTSLLL